MVRVCAASDVFECFNSKCEIDMSKFMVLVRAAAIGCMMIGAVAAYWPALAIADDAAPTLTASVPVPDNSKLTLMIQLHVSALALANLTGNYSVLRDLGSPAFQAANTPEKLAESFSGFRKQGIDISPALLFAPILLGPPQMDANNVMRLAGFYATKPQRIAFELLFQPAGNAWRLADIQVRTVVPQLAQVAPDAAAPTAAEAPAPVVKPKAKKKSP